MSTFAPIDTLPASTTLANADLLSAYVFAGSTFTAHKITFASFAASLPISTATQTALDTINSALASKMNANGSNATLPASDPANGGALFGTLGGTAMISAG